MSDMFIHKQYKNIETKNFDVMETMGDLRWECPEKGEPETEGF